MLFSFLTHENAGRKDINYHKASRLVHASRLIKADPDSSLLLRNEGGNQVLIASRVTRVFVAEGDATWLLGETWTNLEGGLDGCVFSVFLAGQTSTYRERFQMCLISGINPDRAQVV